MGKSSKKSTPKVEAAPAVAPPQSGKKGKREAEETPEKQVAVKKQKKNAGVAQAIVKKEVEAKTQKKKKDEISSSSDDSSDSEDDPAPLKKQPVIAKNDSVPAAKTLKANSSSDSSSDEDDEPDAKKKVAAVKNGPAPAKKVKSSSSSDSSDEDSSSDEDEEPAVKKKVAAVKNGPAPANKVETSSRSDSSDEDSSSDEDEEPSAKTKEVAAVKNGSAPVKKGKSSGSSDSSSEDSSSDEDEESDDSEDEQPADKKDADIEMVDATTPQKIAKQQDLKSGKKPPQTPMTPQVQSTGSKTLFVGNLSYQIEKADVENFFKDAGEVVDVRFSTDAEGNFKGFGHVEFATAEAAQKALELNGEYLLNRAVRLDIARERGAYTPHSGSGNNSFQKSGRGQSQTIFVRGFDSSLGQDEIKSSLEEHFGSCGEISRVAIPSDRETGAVKGYAYLDFNDGDSLNKALELNGSELNSYTLSIEEAKPRGEFRDGPGSGRGGGRSGGRDFGGRGGWSGGRDGGGRGGRGGRRGGGRFGGGGRGRGTPNKPNLAAAGTGKKTTFNVED